MGNEHGALENNASGSDAWLLEEGVQGVRRKGIGGLRGDGVRGDRREGEG